jgi:hypothetical protein
VPSHSFNFHASLHQERYAKWSKGDSLGSHKSLAGIWITEHCPENHYGILEQEAISGIWIRFESKAQVGKKAEHTREYVSILSRPVTPLSGLRRVFEMASSLS